MTNEMVTTVMDFAETVKMVEVMKANAENNIALADRVKANIIALQERVNQDITSYSNKTCHHLTANQKRARAIQMAKEFVKKAIEDACNSDGVITVPDSSGYVNPWCCSEIRFEVNAKKRTVVALAIGAGNGAVVERTIAKCHPDDVFNEHIGKAVALAKILDIVEQLPPDILKAVQPDEIITGHRVKIVCYGSEDEVFGIGTVACKISDDMYLYDKENFEEVRETILEGYWDGEVCTPPNSIIIDDTNAQYETLEGGEN